MWLPQIRDGNVVRWPFASAARSLIRERDIAAVAARALTEEQHAGATYSLSGPEAITQAEQVRTIGEAIGRPLRYEGISRAEAREQILSAWPPTLADGALDGGGHHRPTGAHIPRMGTRSRQRFSLSANDRRYLRPAPPFPWLVA